MGFWENLLGMVTKEKDSIFVALDHKKIVGHVFIIPFGTKVAYIFRLAVCKEYRKKGIATLLISHAEAMYASKGVVEFGLYVDATNISLQDFYKKREFITSNKQWIYMYKIDNKKPPR